MKIENKGIIMAIILSFVGTAWIIFCAGFAHYHAAIVLRNAGELASQIVQHELFMPIMVTIAVAWGGAVLRLQLKELKN